MIIGYGRVSTTDQSLDSQEDALKAAGCEQVYMDKLSGKNTKRPQLTACRAALRPGDTLVVTRLSRLARSLKDLLTLTDEFRDKRITLKAIHQEFDMGSANGRLIMSILGAVDQFQREIIADNTREGLASARARGNVGGRPANLDRNRIKQAKRMKADGDTVASIARTLKVSRSTIYRALAVGENDV